MLVISYLAYTCNAYGECNVFNVSLLPSVYSSKFKNALIESQPLQWRKECNGTFELPSCDNISKNHGNGFLHELLASFAKSYQEIQKKGRVRLIRSLVGKVFLRIKWIFGLANDL